MSLQNMTTIPMEKRPQDGAVSTLDTLQTIFRFVMAYNINIKNKKQCLGKRLAFF